MNLGISKQQADELVEKFITADFTKKHLIESEAIMQALARHFGEDEEEWGIIGLLHDIDWDLTKENPKEHLAKAPDILKEAGATDFLVDAILSHGYGHTDCGAPQDRERSSKLEHSLAAAETLTGLIVASALMQPDKKISSVKLESLEKKFKNKKFAEKCDRNVILECEKIGIPIDEFLKIGLKSLQNISLKIDL